MSQLDTLLKLPGFPITRNRLDDHFNKGTGGWKFINKDSYFTIEKTGLEEIKELSKQKSHLDKFKSRGWIDDDGNVKELKYLYNKLGFRALNEVWLDDNPKVKNILTLGCSDTFGAGSFNNQHWPYFISQALNRNVFNGGVPGGSISDALRSLFIVLEKVKVDTVMMMIPEVARQSYFFYSQTTKGLIRKSTLTSNALDSGPFPKDPQKDAMIEHYRDCHLTDESMYIHFITNMNAIENICRKNNIDLILLPNPLYYLNSYKQYSLKTSGVQMNIGKTCTPARDMLHWGIPFQVKIANYFLRRFGQINDIEIKEIQEKKLL